MATSNLLMSQKKSKGKAVVSHLQQQMHSSSAKCQVEGCSLDLSGAKAYYCKHRVCAMHSKAPKVIVSGLEQRFCQQCSRFHLLAEFDQRKRSCRRRLADHNERRRKPPPGCTTSHVGSLLSSFNEDTNRFRGFVVDFTNPKVLERRQDDEHSSSGSALVKFSTQQDHLPVQVSANDHTFAASQVPPQHNCHPEESTSYGALSLLSTQHWGSRNTRSHQSATISTSNIFEVNEVAQMATKNNYVDNSCGFREHGHSNNSVEQGATLHQVNQPENISSFSGELELALQINHQNSVFDLSRVCGESTSSFNWSH